jgi:TIR domain/Effector-associated domain 7
MIEQIHVRARRFLQEFFNDEELTTFCFDYFPQVYNNFASGMTKNEKVLQLVAHSQRRERFDELLAALQRERPKGYGDYFVEKPHLVAPEPQAPKVVERNPRQIFISHAHQDVEFAQRLAADLQANGWQTWIASDNIHPGEKWVEAINRGLAESGVFVLLLTPEAVDSRWVQSETNVAISMEHRGDLRLLPLNIKSAAMWEAYQWISFQEEYKNGLEALLDVLTPKKIPQNEPQALIREEIKPRELKVEQNDFPVSKTEKQPPLANANWPKRLHLVVAQIKTIPMQILIGGGGIVILLLLVWVFWPKSDPNSVVEPTEMSQVAVAETQTTKETATVQLSSTPTITLESTLPTVTYTLTPTVTATPSSTPVTATLPPSGTPVTVTSTPSNTPSPAPTIDPNVPPLNAKLGDTWTRPKDGMVMVYVPPSSNSYIWGDGLESPSRGYWIDKYEVTDAQYQICVNNGVCRPRSNSLGG